MTEDPLSGKYVRGKLALAGLDLSAPLHLWLDAVYTIWADAPHELLHKMAANMIEKSALVRPEEAREMWGRSPEHRALMGKAGRGPGLEAGRGAGAAPAVPPRRAPGAPPAR